MVPTTAAISDITTMETVQNLNMEPGCFGTLWMVSQDTITQEQKLTT